MISKTCQSCGQTFMLEDMANWRLCQQCSKPKAGRDMGRVETRESFGFLDFLDKLLPKERPMHEQIIEVPEKLRGEVNRVVAEILDQFENLDISLEELEIVVRYSVIRGIRIGR